LVLELDPKSDLGPVQIILTGTRTGSSNQPNTGLGQWQQKEKEVDKHND
jgi:hypothetical protein